MISGLIGLLVGIAVVGLMGGLLIWVLSSLGLGLKVDGFGAAFIAAIVIALVSNVVIWLLSSLGLLPANVGFFGALINLLISAVILLIADRFVAGMKVNGFGGAIIAVIGFGVLQWLTGLIARFFA
ncbi:MAG: phage holin family protein [Chloroflexi bacterium]|nr:phage holin family protein [Chloroflexota bacterium]